MKKTETVLITGASSGIGLAFAQLCAKNGHELILTARRKDELEKIAQQLRKDFSVTVSVITSDLSEASGAHYLWQEVQKGNHQVDILINNAGYGTRGAFVKIPPEADLAMLRVNIVALTELMKYVLPGMIERGAGRILNVASTAAFQPGPFMAAYYASKAYVLSLSEAVHEEVRGTGVTVTALCPGPTRTGFGERAGVEQTVLFRDAVPVERVVEAGYRGLMRGQRVVVPTIRSQFFAILSRFLPRAVVLRIVRSLQAE